MLLHSFWMVRDGMLVHEWNLRNYARLFENRIYLEVLIRSIRIAASVTLLSLILGYPLAYYMSFHGGRRKELMYQLVIIPLWISYLVRGYAWKTILGSEGVLNSFFAVFSHHNRAGQFPALQSIRRCSDVDAHLHTVRVPAPVRVT